MYRYQKGDYESIRAETLKFANEKYFNGYSDTRSVQENFNLITDRQTDRQTDIYFIFLKSYKHDIRDYTYYFYRRHIHDNILQTEYQN